MVFKPTSNAELKTAVHKWYENANDGSTNALENANNYNGSEYQGNPNTWDTSSITDMSNIFENQKYTNNPDISTWDTSIVTTMESMFQSSHFNNNIGNWNVSSVTNMTQMFLQSDFNQSLANWERTDSTLGNVKGMYNMFANNTKFNQDITTWNVSSVTDMRQIFIGAFAFNQPIGNWDTSSATMMHSMFNSARSFNQPIGNWDTSNVTGMNAMFYGATVFNQNINKQTVTVNGKTYTAWDTSKVSDMNWMFLQAYAFNQPIGNWDVSNVKTMWKMFSGNPGRNMLFNQDIGNWDVSSVEDMHQMFLNNTTFNQSIENWIPSSVTTMAGMFESSVYNQPINWNTTSLTDMSQMFVSSEFNQTINLNTSQVTNAKSMFYKAGQFNQNINTKMVTTSTGTSFLAWDMSKVKYMDWMFQNARVFNQPIGNWDTSIVENMQGMFSDANAFNQNINKETVTVNGNSYTAWDTSSVGNMSTMFSVAASFNQPLDNWDTSSVGDMNGMFFNAFNFDQNVGSWDVSSVNNMTSMFASAKKFNNGGSSDIANWDTSNVENMSDMFGRMCPFNQPIMFWNVEKVTNFQNMFYEAPNFAQDIRIWKVRSDANTTDMFYWGYVDIQDYGLYKYFVNNGWYGRSPPSTPFFNFGYIAPKIELQGDNPFTVDALSTIAESDLPTVVGTAYSEANPTGEDITSSITSNFSSFSTSVLGNFNLNYNLTDSAGNPATQVTRVLTVVDKTKPIIKLTAPDDMTINVNSTYVEPGVSATDTVEGDLTSHIQTTITPSGSIDTSKPGKFTIAYNLTDTAGNKAVTEYRYVTVVDTPPTITIGGDNPVQIDIDGTYKDSDYGAVSATDLYDGDITNEITTYTGDVNTKEVGTYNVTYKVTNSVGMESTSIRKVNVIDPYIPVINLLPITEKTPNRTIEINSVFNDPGATAYDQIDGDITSSISTNIPSSGFDTSKTGTFPIYYNVMDTQGNKAVQKTRYVTIINSPPVITLNPPTNTPIVTQWKEPYVDPGATAVNALGQNITSSIVTNLPGGVDINKPGKYYVTYNVTDSSSQLKATQVQRTVIVQDNEPPTIKMIGTSPIKIQQFSKYVDAGAKATDPLDGDITSKINTINNVNTNVVGQYTVEYSVKDVQGNSASATRYVNVVSDPPVIHMIGKSPLNVDYDVPYTDPGASASDSIDGDLTADIKTTGLPINTKVPGTYYVKYNVKDKWGVSAKQVEREVIVYDSFFPTISINGDTPVNIMIGGTVPTKDVGATAKDHVYGDLTSKIKTTSTLDTSKAGTYYVTYSVTNPAGDTSTTRRRINVLDDPPKITILKSNPTTIDVNTTYIDAGAIATDAIDGTLPQSDITSISTVNTSLPGTYTVTYSAIDSYGLKAVPAVRTVIVNDPIPPILTVLGSSPVDINAGETYNDAGATASDAIYGDLTSKIKTTGLPINTKNVGTYYITYTVKDDSGNSASGSRTVNVKYAPPVITLFGLASVTILVDGGKYVDKGAQAYDALDGSVPVVTTGLPINTAVPGVYKVTYNAENSVGMAAKTVTRTVTVLDKQIPTITLAGSTEISIEKNSTYTLLTDKTLNGETTASDPVYGDITKAIVTNIPSGGIDTSAVGSFTITYNVTDVDGNQAKEVKRVVNIVITPPVIQLIGSSDVTHECKSPDAYVDQGATANSVLYGNLTSSIVVSGTVNSDVLGTYTLTYNVKDPADNWATPVTRTVNVIDTKKPGVVINGFKNVYIEQYSTYNDEGAISIDNVEGDITSKITTIGLPIDTSVLGKHTIQYSSTDERNNTYVAYRYVHVENVPPVITITDYLNPPNTIDLGSIYVDKGATATDFIDGELTSKIVTNNPVNTNKPGTYYVTYNVRDSAGIAAKTATRTVVVHDNQIPHIYLQGDEVVEVERYSVYKDAGVIAKDKVDGIITDKVKTTGLPVNTAILGNHTISYNVKDDEGLNAKTVTRTVNVVYIQPVIKLNDPLIMSIDVGQPYTEPGYIASDSVDGTLTDKVVVHNPVNINVPGTYTITYNVRDNAGIKAQQQTRKVTVLDQYTPYITLIGDLNMEIELNSKFVDPGATVHDKIYPGLSKDVETNIPSTGLNTSKVGKFVISYNFENPAGVRAKTVTRTVNILDDAPIVSIHPSSIETVDYSKTYIDPGAYAYDKLDGVLTDKIVTRGLPINTFRPGIYTVVYSVKDNAGLTGQNHRRVVVHDPYIPTIVANGYSPMTVEMNSIYVDPGAKAYDHLDGVITKDIITTNTVNTQKAGTYTVTYNVTDAEGNKAKPWVRTVYVVDDVPIITLNGEAITTVDLGVTYVDAGATAYDNVDGDLTSAIVTTGLPIDTNKSGVYYVRYNVTDTAGLKALEVVRKVTVLDPYMPVIVMLGTDPIEVQLDEKYVDPGAKAFDHVDGDISASIITTSNVNTSKVGTYSVLYNVTDSQGNKARQVFRTVIVYNPNEEKFDLGGPFQGFSAKQTIGNYKGGEQASMRSILRRGWNTAYARGRFNGQNRVTTPFRAVNNSGDFLSRENYKCGGPTPMSKSSIGWAGSKIFLGSQINNCDNTDVPASSTNVKYVNDSSDYITFKKQQAVNRNYNDLKNGGDDHNASYVPLKHTRI